LIAFLAAIYNRSPLRPGRFYHTEGGIEGVLSFAVSGSTSTSNASRRHELRAYLQVSMRITLPFWSFFVNGKMMFLNSAFISHDDVPPV
jgi:hypothetical protein